MKLAGAHLQSLAEEWRFKASELFRQSAEIKLRAEVIDASAAALERAIRHFGRLAANQQQAVDL